VSSSIIILSFIYTHAPHFFSFYYYLLFCLRMLSKPNLDFFVPFLVKKHSKVLGMSLHFFFM
jgi:hypothetical protein